MKLKNPFVGNNFKITQTMHSFDNAIDAIGDSFDMYAVCDMEIKVQEHDGTSPWFRGYYKDLEIRYVHCKLDKPGKFKTGDKIGTYYVPEDPFGEHLHISVKMNGVWLNFMEYLDRNVNLQLSSAFPPSLQYLKDWNTWADKNLYVNNEIMDKNQLFNLLTWYRGTDDLNTDTFYEDYWVKNGYKEVIAAFAKADYRLPDDLSPEGIGLFFLENATKFNKLQF